MQHKIKTNESEILFKKAKEYFPGGVNSPVRAFRSVGGTPLFIEKGDGCHIWDVDDNQFIDFCCSWGPLILGHNNAKVREKVIEVMQNEKFNVMEVNKSLIHQIQQSAGCCHQNIHSTLQGIGLCML